MNVRAFGKKAARVAERFAAGDGFVVACDPSTGGAALPAAVELRRRGYHFFASIVWDDERTRLARARAIAACAQHATYDQVRLTLHDFADSLAAHVDTPLPPGQRGTLHELIRLSDGLLVRSHAERRRIETGLGTIPRAVDVVVADPPALPVVATHPTDVVVYAPHERADALAAYVTALGDFVLPVTFVARDRPRIATSLRFEPPARAADALARARVIVDASANDPGTARMLATLGRPLAISSRSGADELLRNVTTFEPWNRASILAAVADALCGDAPDLRATQPSAAPAARRPIDRIDLPAPLVSVIVTTYDRRVMLGDTLATIERQRYPALEIIVVNDAGGDVSDVVARFPRARLIDHAANRGPAAGRNTGLRAARGDYVTFFDDDDEMFPDHVGALAGALQRSGLDVAYGQMLNAFASTDADGHYRLDGLLAHDALLDHAEIQWLGNLATTAVMFRRELIDVIGALDESLGANEDFEFWMRLAAGRDWARVPDVTSLYFVRTDGSNRSTQNAQQRYLLAHHAIFAKHPSTRELVAAGRTAMVQLLDTPASA